MGFDGGLCVYVGMYLLCMHACNKCINHCVCVCVCGVVWLLYVVMQNFSSFSKTELVERGVCVCGCVCLYLVMGVH